MTKTISNKELQNDANENVQQNSVDLAVIANDITYIKKEVGVISCKLEKDYVTKIEFESKVEPIKTAYDRITWLIISSVILAILGLVFIK